MLGGILMAFLGLACALFAIAPLLRRPPPAHSRAAVEAEALKAQLEELKTDAERGLISPSEAETARIDLSRRLLRADAEAQAQGAHGGASRRASMILAGALVVLGGGAAATLYLGAPDGMVSALPEKPEGLRRVLSGLGRPDLPDLPFAAREGETPAEPEPRIFSQALAEAAANRSGDAPEPEPFTPEAAEFVEALDARLAAEPADLRARLSLANALMSFRRYRRVAEEMTIVIEAVLEDARSENTDRPRPPDWFQAELHMMRAEALLMLAGGRVSTEAEAHVDVALRLNRDAMQARMFKGLAFRQRGDARRAITVWRSMLIDGPADAPWRERTRQMIIEAAIAESLDPVAVLPDEPEAAPPVNPGPSAEDVAAAEALSPEARAEMIAGMVAGLDARLTEEGGTVQEWARLINARIQLGEAEAARNALARAQEAYADDAEALAELAEIAAALGLEP